MSTNNDFEIRQGYYLPHWRADHAIYHVVFRLADGVPASALKLWLREREELLQRSDLSDLERARARYLVSEKTQEFLDVGHGSCILKDPQTAEIVADALRFFDGDRYRLYARCVMPNHVHVLVEPIDHELSIISHSWKSFTAHEIRKRKGGAGSIWHRESYDHIIRNERSYQRAVRYVLESPIRAGLLNWKWTGFNRNRRDGKDTMIERDFRLTASDHWQMRKVFTILGCALASQYGTRTFGMQAFA